MAYALGNVKPNVRQCAEVTGAKFDVGTILGVGSRANVSDHPKGLALDFMSDVAKGRQILVFLKANWDVFGITYLIHEQKIYMSPTDPGKLMEDRGSITANHFDHVHASFKQQAVTGTVVTDGFWNDAPWNTDPGSLSPANPLDAGVTAAATALGFITDSHNWLRALMFVAGLALMSLTLWALMKGQI